MGVSLSVGELSVRFSVSVGKCCSGSGCKQVWGGAASQKTDAEPFVDVTQGNISDNSPHVPTLNFILPSCHCDGSLCFIPRKYTLY